MLCTAFVMNAQTIAPPVVENFDGAEFPPSGWTQQQFVGSQMYLIHISEPTRLLSI